MLSKEIATQMRGRALSWEIFPFSFREFLDFKGIEHEGHLSTFFYTVKLFDASVTRRNANPKKVYCADLAILTRSTRDASTIRPGLSYVQTTKVEEEPPNQTLDELFLAVTAQLVDFSEIAIKEGWSNPMLIISA